MDLHREQRIRIKEEVKEILEKLLLTTTGHPAPNAPPTGLSMMTFPAEQLTTTTTAFTQKITQAGRCTISQKKLIWDCLKMDWALIWDRLTWTPSHPEDITDSRLTDRSWSEY